MTYVNDLFPHIYGINIKTKHRSHPKEIKNSLFWSQIQVTMAWEHKWLLILLADNNYDSVTTFQHVFIC